MISCNFSSIKDIRVGDRIMLGGGESLPAGCASVEIMSGFRGLRSGMELVNEGRSLLRIVSGAWADGVPGAKVWVAEILDLLPDCEILDLAIKKEGYSLAYVTLSDKGAAGQREDKAGPLIAEMIKNALPVSIIQGYLIPDECNDLKALLNHLAHVSCFDMILTTGGTGVGPRDVSPEATLAVIDKRLSGFERAITAAGLEKTPHAMISRAVAGTIGDSVVVNFPGSPKAVRESLEAVLPALRHTVDKLQGDKSDCAIVL
ncbi:MogA/MoaB family molybdenum cofactor biosynthesis protein [Maridesulfovibrio hydrothermalis]|uniref:Molybdopterin adenylyltransferase n=1 Tax=Maridesulfovibrio hydrothermalis AM13 = DSM 14728 TaxID=1121451 RepID=L0RHE6_9BACT|nr:MogA/MoaB family molybdenum cofactor biosynthesis protein [Maridesulfovibrio hydrothermalis]CCO24986.1 Molybdenum cofactor synthesis domain protein [Maridesulfovibrio hydrothermalis AM13 = DSM 14728]